MKFTPAKAAVLSLTILAAGLVTAHHDRTTVPTHAVPAAAAAAGTPYVREELPASRASRLRPLVVKPTPTPVSRVVHHRPAPVVVHHRVAAHVLRAAPSDGVSFSYTEMRVRSCESGPNGYATHGRALDFNYAEDDNASSTASGAWQFLDGTWGDFMGYSRAVYAPRWVQDLKARRYIDANGLRPWYASRSCWAG